MTDFFGSVRNVELHNNTEPHDKERFVFSFLCCHVCFIFFCYLSFLSNDTKVGSQDTKDGSHDAGIASLINEHVNFVSSCNCLNISTHVSY